MRHAVFHCKGITQLPSTINGKHQPWRNGVELLDSAEWNKHFLATGCRGIDILLQGGLREGELTELVGPSSSGKTQVCLCAACHVADSYCGTVVFLDTGNSFSSQRIASIANGLSTHLDKEFQATDGRIKRILSRIFCYSVYDIFELLKMLDQLDFSLKQQVGKEGDRLRLLIVDSLSSVLTPMLGGRHFHGHSLMVTVGFLLKKLADENNLAILVTNHTVGEGSGIKAALGESWKAIPHVRLKLMCNQENKIYKASVLKHPMMMLGTSAVFAIHDSQ